MLYFSSLSKFMVTGDHQLTACAIARQIGLIEDGQRHPVINATTDANANPDEGWDESNNEWAIVQGQQISRLTSVQWDLLILKKQTVVFARTTPEQKLLIVEQCQRRGQIIAMTVRARAT
jgi:sodium/potassium-transporting ATPase subunit alpha